MSEFEKARGGTSSYRSNRSGAQSHSDNSDDEEDSAPWNQKHNKYRKEKGSPMAFGSSSSFSEVKSGGGYGQASQRKKSNNIWGSVLTEQDLTQTLVKSAAVDKPDELAYNERNVESYDFTKKYQDKRHGWDVGDSETSHVKNYADDVSSRTNSVSRSMGGRSIIDYDDTLEKSRDRGDLRHHIGKSNARKRKADNSDRYQPGSVRDRLGVKKVTTMALGTIDLSEDMESGVLSAKIAELLHEPKTELIERIVTHLGKDVAIRILHATKDVEESGGMYTLDGSRRRTSGGVYLTLMKQQPEFNKNVRRLIFVEDIQEMMQHKKQKRKKAKMLKKQQAQKQGQQDSNSRSRSRSSSSKKAKDKAKDAEEDMEDGEIKDEPVKEKSIKKVMRKSRKDEFSDDSSDEEYDNNRSKPFNFEEELAAAKKLILEKSKSENNGQNSETMESECDKSQEKDKGNSSEMADLDSAEADVVDVDLGIDMA